jgi:hypothetical protein
MVIQSEAANNAIAMDGSRADGAIGAIEQTGRQAMTQMRQMLGVLRSGQAPARGKPPTLVPPILITQELLEGAPP